MFKHVIWRDWSLPYFGFPWFFSQIGLFWVYSRIFDPKILKKCKIYIFYLIVGIFGKVIYFLKIFWNLPSISTIFGEILVIIRHLLLKNIWSAILTKIKKNRLKPLIILRFQKTFFSLKALVTSNPPIDISKPLYA